MIFVLELASLVDLTSRNSRSEVISLVVGQQAIFVAQVPAFANKILLEHRHDY